MSIGVKIGVTVISVAAAITFLLLVYKFVKLRCETKDIENPGQRLRQGSDEGKGARFPQKVVNLILLKTFNNYVL